MNKKFLDLLDECKCDGTSTKCKCKKGEKCDGKNCTCGKGTVKEAKETKTSEITDEICDCGGKVKEITYPKLGKVKVCTNPDCKDSKKKKLKEGKSAICPTDAKPAGASCSCGCKDFAEDKEDGKLKCTKCGKASASSAQCSKDESTFDKYLDQLTEGAVDATFRKSLIAAGFPVPSAGLTVDAYNKIKAQLKEKGQSALLKDLDSKITWSKVENDNKSKFGA
jgi:hypothetical protein